MTEKPAQSTSQRATNEPPRSIDYILLDRNRGRLSGPSVFPTRVVGYSAYIERGPDQCRLDIGGELRIYPGFEWDFGSGPAVDTPPMVRASLYHDAMCGLCNRRLVPWSVRKIVDQEFRDYLIYYGTFRWHAWMRYMAVRLYSTTIAAWSDRERAH